MKLDKKKKYVVACSFGPDSMALLHMAIKEGYKLVVAHVNYHKREESNFEENSLRAYCKNHLVPVFVLDTTCLKQTGNFQDWARRVRYEFFKSVLEENECDAVLVAHQEDDLLETFLMQQSKKSFVAHYGIEEETELYGVKVIRPLLSYTKKELEKYDVENNVPYSVDWTNFTNLYTRNKYRHEIVDKMSKEDREKVKKTIEKLNSTKLHAKTDDSYKNRWDLQAFLNESDDLLVLQISNNLQRRSLFKKITQSYVKSVKNSFKSENPNIYSKLLKNIYLVKAYSWVYLVDFDQLKKYEYHIEKPGEYSFEFIDFSFDKNDGDRNLTKDDFPLTIKPVSIEESYKIKDYNSVVRRLFIDWKMPRFLRGWWPGIYNKDGVLVYIPRYRDAYTDNHSSKLVIKFPQF